MPQFNEIFLKACTEPQVNKRNDVYSSIFVERLFLQYLDIVYMSLFIAGLSVYNIFPIILLTFIILLL